MNGQHIGNRNIILFENVYDISQLLLHHLQTSLRRCKQAVLVLVVMMSQ